MHRLHGRTGELERLLHGWRLLAGQHKDNYEDRHERSGHLLWPSLSVVKYILLSLRWRKVLPCVAAWTTVGLGVCQAAGSQPDNPGDPLYGLDPGMPPAVRIEAWNHSAGIDKAPLTQSNIEIAPGWGRLEMYMNQGGFGMQLTSVRSYDTGEFFSYVIPTRTGSIGVREPSYRVVSGGLNSPIEYWRALQGLIRDGGVPTVTNDGPLSIITIDAGNLGPATWRFTLAREPIVELRSLQIDGGSKMMRMSYSDYRDIAGGGRHPFRIDIETIDKSGPPDTRPNPVVLITKVEPLTDLAQPARWALPDEAVIVDHRTGQAANGKGERIDVVPPAGAGGGSAPNRNRGSWLSGGLIFAGVGVVAVGGVVWMRRRFAA